MKGSHGWVTPRPDGMKARCGGPSICAQCALESVVAHQKTPQPSELEECMAVIADVTPRLQQLLDSGELDGYQEHVVQRCVDVLLGRKEPRRQ